jgi:hypothetical protein
MVFWASDRREATAKGTIRFTDLQTRPTEVLVLTSLTMDEFRPLVPPFEAAFQLFDFLGSSVWRFPFFPCEEVS